MSKTYLGVLSFEMPDDSTEEDALTWLASVLDTAWSKPNPVPCPPGGLMRGWTPRVPVPPSEHPYRPRIEGVRRRKDTP